MQWEGQVALVFIMVEGRARMRNDCVCIVSTFHQHLGKEWVCFPGGLPRDGTQGERGLNTVSCQTSKMEPESLLQFSYLLRFYLGM